MMYLLDTADVKKIKKMIEYYPIAGVTTNPTIISNENKEFLKLIKELKKVVGNRMLHVQVTSSNYEDIIKEAHILKNIVGDNLYVKIPISPDGIKATMELKKQGFNITETAIFNQQQALIAAIAGADFVAPYVNRLDNTIADGTNVVKEIVELFNLHNINTKVLAASFKNAEQIHKVSMVGGHAVTISPELLEMLVKSSLTDAAIEKFNSDWTKVYGNKKIVTLDEKEF